MKILCLFVRHGSVQHAEALARLDQWYRDHGLLGNRTLWIIDNALPPGLDPQSPAAGVEVRPGDNRAWEFSAWERALREAGQAGASYDVVHFVTSAFNTLYTEYLRHFRPEMLPAVAANPLCLGHIDGYAAPVVLAGESSANWIRTCFFFLAWRHAVELAPWARFDSAAVVFADETTTVMRAEAPLSADYQQHIRTWLEGTEVGGHAWHSPIGAGRDEVRRFQAKTLAILNEHSLALTLRRRGLALADFCWLYTCWQPDWSAGRVPVPAEAEQLRVRRRVLGIPEPTIPGA